MQTARRGSNDPFCQNHWSAPAYTTDAGTQLWSTLETADIYIQLFLHDFESPSGDGGFPNRRCISYHSEIYRFSRFIEQVISIQGMIAAYFVVVVIGSSVDMKE